MSIKRSYNLKSFSTTIEREVNRLKAQVALFWDKEVSVLKKFGLKNEMSIVECGSGPGYFMEKLLSEFPESHITGIEIDPYLADISKENLSSLGYKNYQIFQKSMMNTELPENAFDFVLTRLVLEHLPDPVGAVKEMCRILKPGGKAILIDNDFEMHLVTFPDIPELAALYHAYCRARMDEGGNPRIGRELPIILKKAGFKNIDMEIVTAHSNMVGDDIFLKSEGVGISLQLVKDGYLKSETLDVITKKWRDVLRQKTHAFYRQLFVATGEKRAADEKVEDEIVQESLTVFATVELVALLATGNSGKTDMLETYLCETIAGALGIDRSEVSGNDSVTDLGCDSLAATDVLSCIERDLGVELSISEFFEKSVVIEIVSVLLKKIEKRDRKDAISDNGINQADSIGKRGSDIPWEEGEL